MKKTFLFLLLLGVYCKDEDKTAYINPDINEITVFDTKNNKVNIIKDPIQIKEIKTILENSKEIKDSSITPNWNYKIEVKVKYEKRPEIWLYDSLGMFSPMEHGYYLNYKIENKQKIDSLIRKK